MEPSSMVRRVEGRTEPGPRGATAVAAAAAWAAVWAAVAVSGCVAPALARGDDGTNRPAAPASYGTAPATVPRPGDESARRPVVAVVADNEGTETTDFLVPYAVLAAAGLAEVRAVGLHPGRIQLMPALAVEAQESLASFDDRYPTGADLVVVPAIHHQGDPSLHAWLRAQIDRGATVAAICDGARVLAGAGLLAGRTATGHWYSIEDLAADHPDTRWVRDRRWVVDGPVMTTAGVSASLPASFALVARLAGARRAGEVAERFGATTWDARHDGRAFELGAGHVVTGAANLLAFWRWNRVGIPVSDGVDEVALALTADAFGRTYRTTVVALADSLAPVTTRHGLKLLPDARSDGPSVVDRSYRLPERDPAHAIDRALATISRDDGPATARFVALQLEYPWPAPAQAAPPLDESTPRSARSAAAPR